MKVTLITLNYNGAESTIRLLESLKNQTDQDFGCVVIDNVSHQADFEHLKSFINIEFASATLFRNTANTGFSGGCNVGIQKALEQGTDWVVILNNDTWVEPDFIVRLKTVLKGPDGIVGLPIDEEGYGVVYGGQLQWLQPTLSHNHGFINKYYTTKNYLTKGTFSRFRRCPLYAIGGGMAIHRSVIDAIGAFDENYFLYFEDVDLTMRAREAGISITFPSKPIVHHTVSASTSKLGLPLLLRYHYRNAIYFNFKNGPILIKILTIFWSVFIVLKQIVKILFDNHTTESRAILAGVIDFYQENMGKIDMRKRIGIECESIEGKDHQWGVGRMIIRLLEELSRKSELEKEFRFILYFKDTVPDFSFLKAPIFTVKIVPVPYFKGRLFPIYYFLILPIKLWFERLDMMFWPNYMLPILAFGKSNVMLTEDIYYEAHDGTLPFRFRLAYKLFGWWSAHCATKIMAISETSKNNVSQLYDIDPNRIFINYLGVDSVNCKLETRNYLLYVGQAFPRRHLKETIEAFNIIAPEFENLQLIAIGPDKYPVPTINFLITRVNKNLGREAIIHKDYVNQDELNELYAGAKALVYVSDREAFGLPPMEALAYGVPLIIADNPLGHELFGEYAWYTQEATADAIATAMRSVLTNTAWRERVTMHGHEFTKQYSWKQFTERWLETIRIL